MKALRKFYLELVKLVIAISKNKSDLVQKYGKFKFSLILGLASAFCFFIFNTFLSNNEFVRKNFIDTADYDIAIKTHSFIKSSDKSPKIIVVLIDETYLKKKNLSKADEPLAANFTPRDLLASLLDELDARTKDQEPKAVLLDYYLAYPSDIKGKVTDDDRLLINALNKYSQRYKIYLPTQKNELFLEPYLDKNITLISTTMHVNSDNITRGYAKFTCKNNKSIPHIAVVLSSGYESFYCDDNKSYDFSQLLSTRVLYKRITKLKNGSLKSNYENISIYSADKLATISGFKDAIVLIGSDYKGSGDIYQTAIDDTRSGVLVLGDAITTAYKITELKQLEPIYSFILYFFMLSSITFLTLKLSPIKSQGVRLTLVTTVNFVIFFTISFFGLFWGYYIPWALPLLSFKGLEIIFAISSYKFRHQKHHKVRRTK